MSLKSASIASPMVLKPIAFACSFLMAALLLTAPGRTAVPRPNIIVILADDLGFGDVSINQSGSWVSTPNIDRIGNQGIRFNAGYASAPVCGPSRVGLLTGRYPARSGVWWNPDTGKAPIPETTTLLPQMLRKAGYRVGIVGKWNIQSDVRDAADVVAHPMIWGGGYWPDDDGKHVGVGIGAGYGAGDRPSGLWGPEREGDRYLTDMLASAAEDFIRSDNRQPFFLYLAFNAPHSPLEAHERYRSQVAHLESEPKRVYGAMVLALDDAVGRVTNVLAERGLAENTLIVFASDNGPAKSDFTGYPASWPKLTLGSTGAFSGTKSTFREGGIRVPFFVRWPSGIPAGSESDQPVSFVDLYPTLAEIAGAKPDEKSDGISLLPLFRSPQASLPVRDQYWVGRECDGKACRDFGAIRRGAWKLLLDKDGSRSLYDLRTDPGEKHDRAASAPTEFSDLSKRFSAWKKQLPANASGVAGPPGRRGKNLKDKSND